MALFLCLVLQALASPDGIVLDESKQLLLDDYLIESKENLTRQVHPAEQHPANPVLWPEEEWEGTVALLYGSVIRDGGTYRMWYLSGPGVSYAESADGIEWSKPALDLFEIDGHPTNAVVRRATPEGAPPSLEHFYELFGAFKDPSEPDPARRYKMGYLSIQRGYSGPRVDPFHGGQRRGLGVAASPDGIHWTTIDAWTTEAICDGASHWMYDPVHEQHVLYGRTKFKDPELEKAWTQEEYVRKYWWGRSVARTESPDFLDWTHKDPTAAPVVMTADGDDPPGTEIYGMAVFPYGSAYIGLVQRFHNRPGDVYLDIQLAVSHDSVHFTRVEGRSPFIPCGPVGSWDRFNNAIANNPPIEVDGKLRFYYSGRTYRHSPYDGPDKGESGGGIGFATIPRDRFVSLGASFDGGALVTKPLRLRNGALHLNADADFGEIAVEALNGAGETIASSEPISQDGLDLPVAWAEGGIPGDAEPVRLRITLRNALLFALWSSP